MYQKLRSYGEWFRRHSVIKRTFCHFEPFFTLSPPSTKKTKVLKKIKKAWKYHPFTNVHHKWRSYDVRFLSYGPQQIEFFVILGYFLPFYPTNNQKNENFEKKMNKILEDIIICYTMIICYSVPEKWCVTNVIFIFHSGLFFALLPSNSPKIKNYKKWKEFLEISSLNTRAPKLWSHDVWFLRYGAWKTDQRMDGQKKWHRGGCIT